MSETRIKVSLSIWSYELWSIYSGASYTSEVNPKNPREILNNLTIDAVYISLRNFMRMEWVAQSIRASYHALLQKLSIGNEPEAEILFSMPELSVPSSSVVLEAFYSHLPMFKYFITPADVVHMHTDSIVP